MWRRLVFPASLIIIGVCGTIIWIRMDLSVRLNTALNAFVGGLQTVDRTNQENFIKAVSEGDQTLVRLALDAGVNPNVPVGNLYALTAAVRYGHFAIVQMLLAHGAVVAQKTPSGYTALMAAVERKDTAMLELLLGHGADASAQLTSGWTVFHEAAAKGKLEHMRLLLRRAKDSSALDQGDANGITPLMYALHKNEHLIAKLLLLSGASASSQSQSKMTPLHWLTSGKIENVELAELLIEKGADVNAADVSGMTPLMAAAHWGHGNLVWYLVTKWADPLKKDNRGRTALGIAKARRHVKVVEFLTQVTQQNPPDDRSPAEGARQ